MKYIEADKLKEEIERRRKFHDDATIIFCNSRTIALTHSAGLKEDEELIKLIDSLQQEQPKQKKNCNDCPHCVDRKDQFGWHFKGCFGGPYNGKFIAEIDECPLQQEQLEVDLGKELEIYLDKMNMYVSSDDGEVKCYNGDCVDSEGDYFRVFKAGFELGLNARKA